MFIDGISRGLMRVAWIAALACVVAASGPSPVGAAARATPTPPPAPSPVADPAVQKIARQQFVAWQSGTIDKSVYAPGLVSKLTDDKVTQVSKALAELGPLTQTEFVGPFEANDIPPDARGYIFRMHCANGAVYQWMILDGKGKIATLFFKNKLDEETIERPGTPPPSPPAAHT